jgi:hypothetical protein
MELSDERKYRLRDRPLFHKSRIASLFVNGDDCCLKGNRLNLRRNWERITSFGGLTTSVGKTFFSSIEKPIAVLNSTTYHLKEGVWKEIKFVNMGIMLGKARSGSGENGKRSFGQLGSLHRELKESTPEKVWDLVSKKFIYYNKNTLLACPDIPWGIPEYLGGAGLCLEKQGLTELDRRCATLLITKKDNDKRFKIMKQKIDPQWKVHDLVGEILENSK